MFKTLNVVETRLNFRWETVRGKATEGGTVPVRNRNL